MTSHRDTDPQSEALKDEGRRDFTRSMIAAGGTLLVAPLVEAAAARPRPRGKACPVRNAYGDGHMPPSRRIYFFYLTNNPERTRAYFIERDDAVTENDIRHEIEVITTQ